MQKKELFSLEKSSIRKKGMGIKGIRKKGKLFERGEIKLIGKKGIL